MNAYLWIKLLHILSATVLFGTGTGIAFFMLRAYLSESREALAITVRNVVLADWIFTTPAVVIQLITGVLLIRQLGIAWCSAWFIAVIGLFILVGACWLPVVWIQIRVRDLLMAEPECDCSRLMRIWVMLGVLAFTSVVVLFLLMVAKPGLNTSLCA